MLDLNSQPPPKKTALEDLFRNCFAAVDPVNDTNKKVAKRMESYKNMPSIPLSGSPLEWWKDNKNTFPVFASMAQAYLSIPATSVASERVFSTAGEIVTSKSSLLSPENVDHLIFLTKNMRNAKDQDVK